MAVCQYVTDIRMGDMGDVRTTSPPYRLFSPMPSPISITRCICQGREFADLLPLARQHNWDLAALMEHTGCGAQCGLCRPYLRRMLKTGRTEFNEIITENG